MRDDLGRTSTVFTRCGHHRSQVVEKSSCKGTTRFAPGLPTGRCSPTPDSGLAGSGGGSGRRDLSTSTLQGGHDFARHTRVTICCSKRDRIASAIRRGTHCPLCGESSSRLRRVTGRKNRSSTGARRVDNRRDRGQTCSHASLGLALAADHATPEICCAILRRRVPF